jgi:hypothetical protein
MKPIVVLFALLLAVLCLSTWETGQAVRQRDDARSKLQRAMKDLDAARDRCGNTPGSLPAPPPTGHPATPGAGTLYLDCGDGFQIGCQTTNKPATLIFEAAR